MSRPTILMAALVVWTGHAAVAQIGATVVEVRTIERDSIVARLSKLSTDGGAILVDDTGQELTIAVSDLVRVTNTVAESNTSKAKPKIQLVNGDILFATVKTQSGDELALESTDLGSLKLPIDIVSGIDFPQARQAGYREGVAWLDRNDKPDQDRILLANGDLVEAFITRVDRNVVTIDDANGESDIPISVVTAIRFLAAPAPRPKGIHYRLTLQNSGVITVADLRWDNDTAWVRTAWKQQLTVEAQRIIATDVFGGRWEWLTANEPISYQHTPMLSLPWSCETNRNVLGGPLKVAGDVFEHGLGVHSKTNLTYDLKGNYRELVTSYGMDDESGKLADVTVSILIDGQRRHEQTHVRRGKLYGPIRLDVARAKRIELVVDFGDRGDLQDRFNWIEPALIK